MIIEGINNLHSTASQLVVPVGDVIAVCEGKGVLQRPLVEKLVELAHIEDAKADRLLAIIFARHQRRRGGKWRRETRKVRFAAVRYR